MPRARCGLGSLLALGATAPLALRLDRFCVGRRHRLGVGRRDIRSRGEAREENFDQFSGMSQVLTALGGPLAGVLQALAPQGTPIDSKSSQPASADGAGTRNLEFLMPNAALDVPDVYKSAALEPDEAPPSLDWWYTYRMDIASTWKRYA